MWKTLALAALLLVTGSASAADQGKVDEAVAKAAAFLKQRAGQPLNTDGGVHGNGEAALMGLAMLEASVPPADPAMKALIQTIRGSALQQTSTYPVSLTVLFLDRLGDPADIPLIQMLGVRLYAGMNGNGGWGYSTWEAGIDQNEMVRLQKAFENRELANEPRQTDPPKPGDPPRPVARVGKLHSEVAKYHAAVIQAIQARGRTNVGDDNSNTQFGMIALWVAQRNGVPAKDAFALIERRFLTTQNPNDGGWGYSGVGSGSTPAMTCAGLLGLALGAGARETKLVAEKKEPPKADPKKPVDDDPFSNPNNPNRPPRAGKDKPAEDGKPPAGLPKSVQAALTSMGQFLQAAKGVRQGNPLGRFVGVGNSFYLLWSMERMAVAYSLDTIGGVNWYDFGAGLLLPAQQADGSWADQQYGAEVNTAFAVLFLTKSNLVRDLSGKIKGTKDPGNTELRGSNAPALLAPPPKDPPKAGGGRPDPAPARPAPTTGGFTLPPVVMPTEKAEAEKAAAALLAATDDWAAKLDQARDTKGSKWSRALALVCAKADGDRRKQAREALAERLTRMTAATLKGMLNDEDAELRRGACLAVAMKEEKALVPDVIDRLADASDPVVRAARAALKSLSGADFGPAPGADEQAKQAAATAWRAWHEARKK